MNNNKSLVEALTRSKFYQEYERAFTDATGLPVTLRPVESWQLPHDGKRAENPLCAMMKEKLGGCVSCLQVPQESSEKGVHKPACVVCPIGLCDTAVPVRMGDQLIGFLQTGKIIRRKPTRAQFQRTARLAAGWGIEVNPVQLCEAYLGARILTAREQRAIIKLLTIFSQHLSLVSNQILVQRANAEPPVIARAKDYISRHSTEDLSLPQVAKAVNTSTFYFCKLFKKHTGINFIDHLARVRIEHAKSLLPNPNLRVSEIAYQVGFQSLTHFNRVFKRIEGQAPTTYRRQPPSGCAKNGADP